MSIPPVLAASGGRAIGRLKRIGRRGLLALLTAALLMLVSVLGALLPDTTLTLTWYVPVLDSAMVVMLAVVLFLPLTEVVFRRHCRLLPLVFACFGIRMLMLPRMPNFPGGLPFQPPFWYR